MREYLYDFASTQDNGFRNSSGIAYVIIKAKNDASRAKYIKDCTIKGCVTIALENGGFLENVPVLKHVWNDIVFPADSNKMGSCVFWTNVPKTNIVVIQGVVPKNNEVINRNENEFLLSRNFTQQVNGKNISNHIEIAGNAIAGKINISVDGGEDNGELLINIFNKNKSSKLTVNTKGNVTFNVSGKMDLFTSKGISIRNDKETFITLLTDLIKEFKNSIIQTPSGAGNISPTTIQLIEKVETRIQTLFIENGSK